MIQSTSPKRNRSKNDSSDFLAHESSLESNKRSRRYSSSSEPSGSEGEESEEDSYEYSNEVPRTPQSLSPNKTPANDPNYEWITPTFIGFIVVALLPILVYPFTNLTEETLNIESVRENFPTQNEDLWLAFESGVQDVNLRNRPSTFIFLYQEEAEQTMKNLLDQLSKFAVCNISDCSRKPIILTDSELNSAEVVRNYGTLIEKYRDKLRQNGVMIIKNLENVCGISAQVFHTFCDEFTPLVEKSLFIFTMKVKNLHGSKNMKFVDEFFRKKWTDIKIDTFNALITRITSMVVEVVP